MARSCDRVLQTRCSEKVRHWKGGGALKPREVVMALSSRSIWTRLSDIWSGVLGGPVWSQKLDLRILVGPFQLSIFYDSLNFHDTCGSVVSLSNRTPSCPVKRG